MKMKKNLFILALLLPMFLLTACSSSDDDKSTVTMSRVTKEQLESGTGTFALTTSSKIYFLSFKGNLMYLTYDGIKVTDLYIQDYSISGDSITVGENKFYIQMVNWGTPKVGSTGTGGVQLLIRGNLPYGMRDGYYDSSSVNLRNL